MLKRIAILTVILAVAQTPLSSTGETSDHGRTAQQKTNQSRDGVQTPSSTPTPARPHVAEGSLDKSQSNKHATGDNRAGMNATETASSPIPWRIREWIAWGANLALAIGGLIGIGIAVNTLGWLRHQSLSARIAAKAALKQTNHQAASERAWVTVIPYIWSPDFYPLWEQNDPTPQDPKGMMPTAHQLPMKIKNVGNTPAKIEGLAAHYIRIHKPPIEAMCAEPDYGEIDHEADGRFLIPNDEMAVTPILMPKATLTKTDVKAIQCQDEFLYAYGIVFYRDVFGVLHETRWGYVYRFPQGVLTTNDKAVFDPDGPSEYNKHT